MIASSFDLFCFISICFKLISSFSLAGYGTDFCRIQGLDVAIFRWKRCCTLEVGASPNVIVTVSSAAAVLSSSAVARWQRGVLPRFEIEDFRVVEGLQMAAARNLERGGSIGDEES